MTTVDLGKGDTMVSDIHADDFAGICFHKQDMPIGQETDEHKGKTDEEVEAFLRIITTDVRSLDVIIAACERAKSSLPNTENKEPQAVHEKTLHNSEVSGARQNVPDITVVGNGDAFQLLCKASSQSEGWMKSTKAMYIPGIGCLVQVTTQQKNADGSYAIAEALTFVPCVQIADDVNHGHRLICG